MQAASMLAVGQSSLSTDSQLGFCPRGFDLHKLSQLHQQAFSEAQLALTQPRMDDFLEQIMPLSWSEMGSVNKSPWDFHGCTSGIQLMQSVAPNTSPGLPCQDSDLKESSSQPQIDIVQYPFDDDLSAIRLPQQCIQEALVGTTGMPFLSNFKGTSPPKGDLNVSHLRTISQGMPTAESVRMPLNSGNYVLNSAASQGSTIVTSPTPGRAISPSTGSNGMVGSGCQPSSPKSLANLKVAPWHQPYLNGALSHPLDAKSKIFPTQEGTTVGASFPGKRSGDDADDMQGGQGFLMPTYGSQTGVAPQGAAGTARPRVRARRGQATDPHSIAERLRRERIAERMKQLQELVPNANKTDKASMLDEIIEYVKFLQLQVKVLSMSRLSGAGAVASLVTDLSLEGQNNYFAAAALNQNAVSSSSLQDGMALAERQVARLMEEDMGSAMQFLQSKGLCLMPVSLANFISSTDSRFGEGVQCSTVDQSQREALSFTSVEGCTNTLTSGVILPSPTGSIAAED